MKARHHHSSRSFAPFASSRRYQRALLALGVFFMLPGLLAAQEAGGGLQNQAAAASVAAAQPGSAGAAPAPLELSREVRSERLWLLPRHAEFTDLLARAAQRAVQHPDCNELLYGSLNEFRTERMGTSFTILCIKDARTTFNQVFYADDLLTAEERAAKEETTAADELERLRQMMQSEQSTSPADAGQAAPDDSMATPPLL